MASDFYRSLHPGRVTRSLAKKAAKNKLAAFFVTLGCIIFLYLLFDNKGILTRMRLETQRADLHAKVVADTAETRRLREQIRMLEGDRQTIEKIAREKYVMARPGETVYRIKKDDNAR
jgi:cell division protein FtsB